MNQKPILWNLILAQNLEALFLIRNSSTATAHNQFKSGLHCIVLHS